MGLYDEAVEELQEAWRLFTRKGDVHARECCRKLVDCYMVLNWFDQAAQWCERGIELYGEDSIEGRTFIYQLAVICDQLGDLARATELRASLGGFQPEERELPFPATRTGSHEVEETPPPRLALKALRGLNNEEFMLDETKTEFVIGRNPHCEI